MCMDDMLVCTYPTFNMQEYDMPALANEAPEQGSPPKMSFRACTIHSSFSRHAYLHHQ